jgi:hypothetical protein
MRQPPTKDAGSAATEPSAKELLPPDSNELAQNFKAEPPWTVARRINKSDLPPGVKHLLGALTEYRNCSDPGRPVHPSVRTLAEDMSVAESTARVRINLAVELGVLEPLSHRRGGRGKDRSARYRIRLPHLRNPSPPESDAQPTGNERPAQRIPALNPPESGPEHTKELPKNSSTQPGADDVFSRLGIDPSLRNHPNATPERLAFIDRESRVRKVNSPGYWAECIRKGWLITAPEADAKADWKRRWEAALARFKAMPEHERANVLHKARTWIGEWDKPDDDPNLLNAVAQVIDPSLRSNSSKGGR